jgi:hypothetical protein
MNSATTSMNQNALWRKGKPRHFETDNQQHERRTALSAALDYAARGWAVFPCHPRAKEPATGSGGFYNAATNPATIRRWWLANPDYNIGVRTGPASRVFVFDVDGSIGAQTLQELEGKHGPLLATLTSATSGGCHFWFSADGPIPCRVGGQGGFPPGLDIRGDGGYAVAPPSVHPDGPTYRWLNDLRPAPAPAWLIRLAHSKPAPEPRTTPVPHVRRHQAPFDGIYGQAALDAEIDALVRAPLGTRNHTLNRAAFCLFQLVAGGELDGEFVHQCLIDAATANGLMSDPADGPRKVAATIASGARAGMQNPRSRRCGP